MIPHGVEIFVAVAPIDMRWSFDRLACLVEGQLGRGVRSRALFMFFGKRRDALKLLFFDGTGLCIFYKRLDRGTFKAPEPGADGVASVEIDERALDDLLDGIALDAAPKRSRKRTSKAVVH
jgi:transposase